MKVEGRKKGGGGREFDAMCSRVRSSGRGFEIIHGDLTFSW